MGPAELSRVKGVLFDLGGTLDGDGEHWLNRFFVLYQAHLPRVSFEDLKAAFYEAEAACLAEPGVAGLGLDGLVEFHVRRQLQTLKVDSPDLGSALSQAFVASCRRCLERNAGVLARLFRRFRLGVITNWYGNAERLLAEEGLAPSLCAVVDSKAAGLRKPDPAIFRLALEKLGLPAEQVMYVGDSYGQDIRPAKGEGLITVWLRNDAMAAPLPPDFDPKAADYQIRTLPEVEALLT